MMLIDSNHRALDFQYILWRFDTSQLDMVELAKLDAGPNNEDDENDDENVDSQGNEIVIGSKKVE